MEAKSLELHTRGLDAAEVLASREKYGRNVMESASTPAFLLALRELLGEPMLILLLVATTVYFITGETADGFFMLGAIVFVAAISLYQETRSRNALKELKQLTQPRARVVREGKIIEIDIEDIVMGDAILIEEGGSVPADSEIIHANDFSVNESALTGESMPVFKNEMSDDRTVYKGTAVATGLAVCRVTAIGNATRLGQIGKSLADITPGQTPLHRQISRFVKMMAAVGTMFFLLVWIIHYTKSGSFSDSLLKALTMAMSIIPEEIPVAFSTFMALGARRLMKQGVVVKQVSTVETLGSANVICLDKTGTITENRMSVAEIFSIRSGKIKVPDGSYTDDEHELIRLAMWASEPIPFDPMEKALHDLYALSVIEDQRPEYRMVHEYPLSGRPPMMTHIHENESGHRIVAAKGAPEALLRQSDLSDADKKEVLRIFNSMTEKGFRVLGVAEAELQGRPFPEKQEHISYSFRGLIAFYDPPKKNISDVFRSFYNAGVELKIVTGDNAMTTKTIARETGFRGTENVVNGEDLMAMDEGKMDEAVLKNGIFARVFPDVKLRIIEILKQNGQVVAMTGDGVNDAPALKSANIGIAMGKRGTEIAKKASALVLSDDDLSRMVDAIAMGRRIYANLKKAIQYIISIHIPIILTVFVPLVAGWAYPDIFSPVHIIFFEIIMGPTCSIIYENEPIEKNLMMQKPRPVSTTFFRFRELFTSIIQGMVIAAGTLIVFRYGIVAGYSEEETRTMVFLCLITSNIVLTLVNRSFYFSVISTLKYKNNLLALIIAVTVLFTVLLLILPPLSGLFGLVAPDMNMMLLSCITGFASVIWFEAVKWIRRRQEPLPFTE